MHRADEHRHAGQLRPRHRRQHQARAHGARHVPAQGGPRCAHNSYSTLYALNITMSVHTCTRTFLYVLVHVQSLKSQFWEKYLEIK